MREGVGGQDGAILSVDGDLYRSWIAAADGGDVEGEGAGGAVDTGDG